jgi:hypothetical protein
MSTWRYDRPPRPISSAKLDNLVLVPASLLSKMATYQAAANRLPRGQVLIVLPSLEGAPRQTMEKVASHLRSHGQQVTTIAADRLILLSEFKLSLFVRIDK